MPSFDLVPTAKEKFLEVVETEINNLYIDDADVKEGEILKGSARHLVITDNAKRSRPWLVYLFGSALGVDQDAMVNISIASELIHAASLLHDDVIDEADLRRGKPTVNVLHSNTIAVLAGDLVLSEAIHRLAALPKNIMVEAVDVVKQMSISAALEVQFRGNIEIGEKEWLKIAHGKTASLFSWSGSSMAMVKNLTKETEIFRKSCYHLGVAFQIADDLKDFYTDNEIKGKYADLRNQNPNLVLLTAAAADASIKESIKNLWKKENFDRSEIERLALLIAEKGYVEDVLNRLLEEIKAALTCIEEVNHATLKDELLDWINKLYSSMAKNVVDPDQKGLTDITNLSFIS